MLGSSISLMNRDFELVLFTGKQSLDHPPLFRVGFSGEQVFQMGDIGPCDEPVHDSPFNYRSDACGREVTPGAVGILPHLFTCRIAGLV